MDRDYLQLKAAERLEKNRRLVCQWATGCGKTNVALKFLLKHPDYNCLILVPEQNNIENWRHEFIKFNVPDDNVTIICYASLHKYENTNWDLLVLDEVPHMDTEKRTALCKSVSGKYVLALGAVVDEDEMNTLQSVYGEFDISRISLKDAINNNYLPIPTVKVIHMQMDNKSLTHWYMGRMYTTRGLYDLLNKKVERAVNTYNAKSNEFNRMNMLRAGNERKKFLGNEKEAAIRKICTRLSRESKRFLCFCSSIDQANKLGKDNAFTSKSSKSFNHLAKFNNHEIDSLYVVGKLIEGQNLVDIHCGVIGQLGGTSRITVQECGRIMRSENPVIYVPVFDDTKDSSFLYTLTSNIPADYIKHYKF